MAGLESWFRQVKAKGKTAVTPSFYEQGTKVIDTYRTPAHKYFVRVELLPGRAKPTGSTGGFGQ
ncbi:hypothetical protein GCM10023186_42200 [Hymenobacter koreensis]|uniref:Uncharacterized protein n=1 Tax=Hymenobacter koreensis TaxID=1084523 RepID=A0ABP8JKF9_9BACT